MIPAFSTDGNLPPGIHDAQWTQFKRRFGVSAHRRILLSGMLKVLRQLKLAGCSIAYIDGSFVTAEVAPKDYDLCYDVRGVDPQLLDSVFFDMRAGRAAQKVKYGGEFFPSTASAAPGYSFLDFFQVDKRTGAPKGIVAIDLRSEL